MAKKRKAQMRANNRAKTQAVAKEVFWLSALFKKESLKKRLLQFAATALSLLITYWLCRLPLQTWWATSNNRVSLAYWVTQNKVILSHLSSMGLLSWLTYILVTGLYMMVSSCRLTTTNLWVQWTWYELKYLSPLQYVGKRKVTS